MASVVEESMPPLRSTTAFVDTLLSPLCIGPQNVVNLKLESNLQSVIQDPLGEPGRIQPVMGWGEKDGNFFC